MVRCLLPGGMAGRRATFEAADLGSGRASRLPRAATAISSREVADSGGRTASGRLDAVRAEQDGARPQARRGHRRR